MTDYNLERLNILIIDDNKHMRALIKSILNALGVRNVLEASDGADAFKELRHFPADIIICDWAMDPLDGIDFTRMVRTASDSSNPFIPIIMLTGYTEMMRVVDARDSGVTEFLAKPVSATKLYGRVKSIIEHPRPFVKTTGMNAYFGPTRRRDRRTSYKGSERRSKAATVVPGDPFGHLLSSDDSMSPDAVEEMLRS
ncbi:MAG: response regulator [Rhodospirillaceae bacterium]|jgi:CheY-like chemotaxis protein|nr:response regulator [Rhodospirillales bacterium]MBT3905596.1 response regulator [Rhodospirillaceae bacterium]MBT4703531.1 response regulator [Rhodospirillaceae bacterium]MBT5034883.1 response regulator [Rhodospirillaceae bacterium]MBT6221652.1 response regulator [Rhodospirillaceae bacterium]